MKLEDRVAVVTGAGQGIGRAYAHRLVEEGARVVVAELNEAKGKAVAEECLAAGGQSMFVRTDVADEASCQEMVAATLRQFGRLDILVNNAAIFSTITMKPFWELGDFGITVNTITPGATYTEIPRETVTPEQREAMLRAQCIKRPEEPRDLVGTVVFLASDDAAFITGQTITVNGGLTFY